MASEVVVDVRSGRRVCFCIPEEGDIDLTTLLPLPEGARFVFSYKGHVFPQVVSSDTQPLSDVVYCHTIDAPSCSKNAFWAFLGCLRGNGFFLPKDLKKKIYTHYVELCYSSVYICGPMEEVACSRPWVGPVGSPLPCWQCFLCDKKKKKKDDADDVGMVSVVSKLQYEMCGVEHFNSYHEDLNFFSEMCEMGVATRVCECVENEQKVWIDILLEAQQEVEPVVELMRASSADNNDAYSQVPQAIQNIVQSYHTDVLDILTNAVEIIHSRKSIIISSNDPISISRREVEEIHFLASRVLNPMRTKLLHIVQEMEQDDFFAYLAQHGHMVSHVFMKPLQEMLKKWAHFDPKNVTKYFFARGTNLCANMTNAQMIDYLLEELAM